MALPIYYTSVTLMLRALCLPANMAITLGAMCSRVAYTPCAALAGKYVHVTPCGALAGKCVHFTPFAVRFVVRAERAGV